MAEWRRVYLGMFTTAFDAAGKDDYPKIPCLVVAGFVAPADAWIAFEPEWKRLLGPLSVWETAQMARQRPDILRELVAMIPAYGIRKFSVGIDLNELVNVPDDIRRNFKLHAYPLCARTLATYVDLWSMHERPAHILRDQIEWIFEEGESRNEKEALVNLMLDDGFPRPHFRYKKDCEIRGTKHKGFTPLQAADILAWHVYQSMKEWSATPQPERTEELAHRLGRLPFRELENLPDPQRTITPKDLQSYIESRTYIELRRRMMNAQGAAPFDFEPL